MFEKLKIGKKGFTLGDLGSIALAFGVGIIVVSIAADIVTNIQSGQTSGTYAYNASSKGLEGLKKVSDWFPTIGLVAAAAIVIGIIVSYLARR